MAGPKLPDFRTIMQAGVDPMTNLPFKMMDNSQLKQDLRMFFRIIDEANAIQRYTWTNLPTTINGDDLERFLYYKGQLAFFKLPNTDDFYFMPFALDGSIDFYGRFNTIHPVPMTSGQEQKEKEDDKVKALAAFLSTLKLQPVFSTPDHMFTEDEQEGRCVLLWDYPKQLSETIIARRFLHEPIIGVMAECIPFMRTSLLAGSGIKGMRVSGADQQKEVKDASHQVTTAALSGEIWIPILGDLDFQELTDGQPIKAQEYMLALNSLDNLRLSGYGLTNGGVFEKQAHVLETEEEVAQSTIDHPLQVGLNLRQQFCVIANAVFGTAIWCEISEGADGIGGDILQDEDDGSEPSGDGGSDDAPAV